MEMRIRAMAGLVVAAWLIWFCFWAVQTKPDANVANPAQVVVPAAK